MVATEETTALTTRTVALDSYSPVELAARLIELKQENAALQEFFQAVMVKDHDYGVIPGTGKPTLLKPGAEKLAEYYGYAPTVKGIDETADVQSGFYRARVTIALVSKRTGTVIAEGVGEANTKEGRYRWRDAQRLCPDCNKPTIIKGKAEYGGGWLCFAKKGGCGAKFNEGDRSIEGQEAGRVENDDPWTLWNTVLKMGKKRGLVDAVLSATRSSGLFTQDMEDLTGWVEGEFTVKEETREPMRQANRPAPPEGEWREERPANESEQTPAPTGAIVLCKFCNSACHDYRDAKKQGTKPEAFPDYRCRKGDGAAWKQSDGDLRWIRSANPAPTR